jgi:mannosyltransferase
MNQATQPLPLPAELRVPDRARPSTTSSAWLLALITIAAAVLRFHNIVAKSFWLDEGISVQIARLPWPQFFSELRHLEANMALYYLLLHFWLALGSTEGLIRALSVLFSLATLPVLYALGARLFGRGAGLLAAWLLAVNAFHIRYAQEARSYSLLVFLAVVATWLLVRNLQEPSLACWWGYALTCALAAYSHFFGVLIVPAHVLSLAFLPREDVPWKDFLRSLAKFSGLVLPLAIFLLETKTKLSWLPKPGVGTVVRFFFMMAGNDGVRLLMFDGAALGLALVGGWHAWRKSGRSLDAWGYVLVFSWLFVPVGITLIGSLVSPMFFGRFLIPCLPALILIVSAGISRLRPQALGWLLCLMVSAASLWGANSYYRQDFDLDRENWRQATSFVLDHAQPGDDIFFYAGAGRIPFEYYRSLRNPAPPWPRPLETQIIADAMFGSEADSLRNVRPPGNRVWLVLSYYTNSSGIPTRESIMVRAKYGENRRVVVKQTVPGIEVLLLSRDAADAGHADVSSYGALTPQLPSSDQVSRQAERGSVP